MWFLLYREVKGVEKREFKEIRKVSKVCQLKISHSASSLILKLDMQVQLSVRLSTSQNFSLLCFLLLNQRPPNQDGRHLRDFVQLGGLGVGDWEAVWWCGGGWSSRLEAPPQTLATPPSACRGARRLISKFITSSANLSPTAGLPLTHSRQAAVCAAGSFEVRQRARQVQKCTSDCSPPDAFRREYISTFTLH